MKNSNEKLSTETGQAHLISTGEAPLRRAFQAERLHRPAQAAEDFRNGNQAVLFVSRGLFSHRTQTSPHISAIL